MWSRNNTQRNDPFYHTLLDTLGAHTLCDNDEGDGGDDAQDDVRDGDGRS